LRLPGIDHANAAVLEIGDGPSRHAGISGAGNRRNLGIELMIRRPARRRATAIAA
jgi:hypothetical protein